jgi:hypothetical protein
MDLAVLAYILLSGVRYDRSSLFPGVSWAHMQCCISSTVRGQLVRGIRPHIVEKLSYNPDTALESGLHQCISTELISCTSIDLSSQQGFDYSLLSCCGRSYECCVTYTVGLV